MAKKKASKKEQAVKNEEPLTAPDFYVSNFEELREAWQVLDLTPIEKVMAIELLSHDVEFIPQKDYDLHEGTQCHGKKSFRFDFFIPYMPNNGIVVECDGKVHNSSDNFSYDRDRNNFVTSDGYVVLRFSGTDIYENFDGYVWPTIEKTMDWMQHNQEYYQFYLRHTDLREKEKAAELALVEDIPF